ncbi:MAG TPA: 2-oxo acid dehydrogenase subunit E2 [Streptosporangiaceae bacterium]
MSVSVSMPQLGESVTEGTVTRWLKREGDRVEADEPLLEVSTDKVDTEIPSPVSGILRGITVAEDETVEVGAELAVIDTDGAGDGADSAAGGQAAAPAEQAGPGGDGAAPDGQPAAPAAEHDTAPRSAAGYQEPQAAPQPGPSQGDPYQQQGYQQPYQDPYQQPYQQPGYQQQAPAYQQPYQDQPSGYPQPAQAPGGAPAAAGPAGTGQAPPAGPRQPEAGSAPPPAEPAQPQAGPAQPQAGPAQPEVNGSAPADAGPPLPGPEGPYVTPLVRKLAAEHGIDLASVAGTGVGGRIRKQDVLDAANARRAQGQVQQGQAQQGQAQPGPYGGPQAGLPQAGAVQPGATLPGAPWPPARPGAAQPAPAQPAPAQPGTAQPGPAQHSTAQPGAAQPGTAPPAPARPAPPPGPAPAGPAAAAPPAPGGQDRAAPRPEIVPSSLRGTTEKMSRSRQVIAQRMVESLQTSAQLTTVVEADVTAIARLRDRARAAFEAREGVKLSFLPFFALAAVEALKVHPKLNAVVDTASSQVTYHDAEHLGIAVDTERGLMVPVIRKAGDLNIAGLARKIADLAERTRAGRVGPDELSGGTFTLTNTGSRGALFDTPIINQPQVGILGTGIVVKRPVVVEDAALGEVITVRSMVYLALTYDHRLVDGADAARFLATVKARLEEGAFETELGL